MGLKFIIHDRQVHGPTLEATRGILFFAVPHQGMDVDDMINAIKHRGTSQAILSQISDETHWRQDIASFVNVIEDCKLVVASFYEIELTKRLKMVGVTLDCTISILIVTANRWILCTYWGFRPSTPTAECYSRPVGQKGEQISYPCRPFSHCQI